MSLTSAIDHLLKAKRISAPSQSYKKDNPVEAQKVFAYLQGGPRPSGVTSEMGMGLVEVEDERRSVPPPPTGNVLYAHDYTGAQAVAPSYGWDWGFMLEGNSQAQIIPDGLAPGVPSMRATLPSSSASMHVEGVKKWFPWSAGERLFFGQQFKLPTDWQTPGPWGAAIAQLYYQSCVNHTWGLFAWGDHCRFVLLSGLQVISAGGSVTRQYDNSDGAPQGPSPRAIPVGRMTKGVTHTLISEIVASYDPTGMTRIWHKIQGESAYTKTVDVSGVPTLQHGQCYAGNTWPKGATFNVSHKFGFYAGNASFTRTFDSGNYVIGDSFAAVAARMA